MATRRGEAYRRFFQRLIDELREGHGFTRARVAQPRNFHHFASGDAPGVYYDAFFAAGGRAVASVLIRRGWEDTRRIYGRLERDKAGIESEFGSRLRWSNPRDVRACSIGVGRAGSIEGDAQTLEESHAWFVENLLRFKRVFGPRLRSLKDG
ncbi:MAG TPA: DUF4268 domain-containing protein [Pyrinomonadaceae bacterium]|jgi:hypothetical protein